MEMQELIADVRRMTAEPIVGAYSDEDIQNKILRAAVSDKDGRSPDDYGWIPTYDLNKVAADIWEEKAAAVADEIDFAADGGSFQRSQRQANYLQMASRYRGKSKSTMITLKSAPLKRASTHGWQDIPYKDWVDDYEQGLV